MCVFVSRFQVPEQEGEEKNTTETLPGQRSSPPIAAPASSSAQSGKNFRHHHAAQRLPVFTFRRQDLFSFPFDKTRKILIYPGFSNIGGLPEIG
jgi:hypothetical protein